MSAGWFFTYVASDGSEADWPASADSPFYKSFDGQIWTFKERKFITEGLSEAGFWQLRQTTKCPALPVKPAEPPEAVGYGKWTISSAVEFAQTLDHRSLQDCLARDPDFEKALNAAKRERRELEGDSASVKEAKFFMAANAADREQKRMRDLARWS